MASTPYAFPITPATEPEPAPAPVAPVEPAPAPTSEPAVTG